MEYAFAIIGYIISLVLGFCCLVSVASIISHIVRRHILGDRQRDLVSKINWSIQQQYDEKEIEAMKFEEQSVFSTMLYHRRMIIMNGVNLIVLIIFLFIAVFIVRLG